MARRLRYLSKLRIDEVSSVDHAANPYAKIVFMKRDQDNTDIVNDGVMELAEYVGEIIVDENIVNKEATITKCIADFGDYLKAATAQGMHDKKRRNAERMMEQLSEDEKETQRKNQMSRTDEMIEMHKFIKSTPGGFNSIAKRTVEQGGTSLTEHEYTELWKADAGSLKDFVKEFEGPRTVKHQGYVIARDATHVKTYMKSYPGEMSVEPLSAETGATDVYSDANKAAAQLQKLVEEQRAKAPTLTTSQLYERVMADPNNKALVGRAWRSSNSYDTELQR
jgi:hypothetical protein